MTTQVTYQGETLEDLTALLNYVNDALNSGYDFENWERKEFEESRREYQFKIDSIYRTIEEIKNGN